MRRRAACRHEHLHGGDPYTKFLRLPLMGFRCHRAVLFSRSIACISGSSGVRMAVHRDAEVLGGARCDYSAHRRDGLHLHRGGGEHLHHHWLLQRLLTQHHGGERLVENGERSDGTTGILIDQLQFLEEEFELELLHAQVVPQREDT